MDGKILGLLMLCIAGFCGANHSLKKRSAYDIRKQIAVVAESKVGSADWSLASSRKPGTNKWKCNYFVYEVGKEAGASMPVRKFLFFVKGPIGAGVGGWGLAKKVDYWVEMSNFKRGDVVVAKHKTTGNFHLGIYVGSGKTVHAAEFEVKRNEWPKGSFSDDYEDIRRWRYIG